MVAAGISDQSPEAMVPSMVEVDGAEPWAAARAVAFLRSFSCQEGHTILYGFPGTGAAGERLRISVSVANYAYILVLERAVPRHAFGTSDVAYGVVIPSADDHYRVVVRRVG